MKISVVLLFLVHAIATAESAKDRHASLRRLLKDRGLPFGNDIKTRQSKEGKPLSLRKSSRTLQDSPCSVPVDDILSGPFFTKPSYLVSCLQSLTVDKDLMMQHIESYKEIFKDYFCFYNINNDAAYSDPINFQPELGYSLFRGASEGQSNLEQDLNDILHKVSSEGANVGNFWDLQTIFNSLRDAHVSIGSVAGPVRDLIDSSVFVLPARNIDEITTTVLSWDPSYNGDGELEIKVGFQSDADGTFSEETIVSINGMSPFQWYYDLVANPALGGLFPHQSVGARMNEAFQSVTPLGPFAIALFGTFPPDVFPDSFQVIYASGNEETYTTGAAIVDHGPESLHEYLNSNPTFDGPGPAYTNFVIALQQIEDATSSRVRPMLPVPQVPLKDLAGLTDGATDSVADAEEPFEFDEPLFVSGLALIGQVGFKQVGAFRITDDYAVLKLWDFLFIEGADGGPGMPEIWSKFTAAAKARGVKKAMIDISTNPGGWVPTGFELVISMYPFVPFEVFE